MSYVGNTATQQAFSPAIDYFSGNGSATSFTLSRAVASVAQVQVVIENVPQNPTDAFTVSGNTITFTSAPPSGTNNIYVYYTSPITSVITPGYGTVGLSQFSASGNASASTYLRGDNSWQVVAVTPTAVSDQNNTSTGYFDLPAGTTAQRPASPANGMTRFNTTLGYPEWYSETYSTWIPFYDAGPYSLEYLIIAGGAGGSGAHSGGGGGAGGVVYGTTAVITASTYSLIVGAGGSGGSGAGGNGSNSTGFSITAIGGGQGGVEAGPTTGSSGGSGGGGAGGQGSSLAGGSGTSGQGNAGGIGNNGGSNYGSGGGGGGASGVGGNGVSGMSSSNAGATGGSGTNAYSAWASATSTGVGGYYAGGGGGGCWNNGSFGQGAAGGAGGGGAGGNDASTSGQAATANTGSGGGGSPGSTPSPRAGGAGGSGIVIVRYLGAQRGSGGTVVSSGGYTYHTFTSSGTFTA